MLEGVTGDQLDCLLQNWKVGVVRLSADFRMEAVNAEFERIDGRTAEELIGREIWEAWPNIVGGQVEALIRSATVNRKGGTVPVYRTVRPGRVIHLDVRAQPWADGVALFVLDVSEWMDLETEKSDIERRYMLAAKATLDVQYEWDIENDIWRANGGAEEILGVEEGAALKIKDITQHIHPDDIDRLRENFREALVRGESEWVSDYRYKRNGEWARLRDRAFLISDSEGKAVKAVGAISDISETEESNQEIKRLQSELIHVSRVSAMGTMATVLAHELNQPLAAVGSYLAGAERLLKDASEIDRDLLLQAVKQAHEGSSRAGKIIQRLRSMTRKADHQRETVKLSKAIDNAVALALIGRMHLKETLEIDVSRSLEMQADAIQLEQVLINLIRNAVEANEEAGRTGVVISARKLSGDMVGITITDRGAGIPEDLRPRLFDFFVSSKADGMGIGLPISRTIVESHGGKINVEHGARYGTTFRIVLPVDGH